MNEKHSNDSHVVDPTEKAIVTGAESNPTHGRRPYQKPAFRFERVFETSALSCGKTSPVQGQCVSSMKTS
jgi:hypothetical protein